MAKDPSMKKAEKEARQCAKEASLPLKKSLHQDESFSFTDQDLLPAADQGRKFDASVADQHFTKSASQLPSSELANFLNTTKKPEPLEEREAFLLPSQEILAHSCAKVDHPSVETKVLPSEEHLEICRESGIYQMALSQTLSVKVTPTLKETIRRCQGHPLVKTYHTSPQAQQHRDALKKRLKNHSEVASYEVHREGQQVVASWKHHDNASSCDHFTTEEKVIQSGQEEEMWAFDDPVMASLIESNPDSRLLYTQVIQGPETRMIQGMPVTREVWTRRLHFSIAPPSDSPCAKLRAQGGVLVQKKCLQSNLLGECDLWEKVYDLGKKGPSVLTKALFKDEKIGGLDQDFETLQENSTDFGQALSTLAVFVDLENHLEHQGGDFKDSLQIFKGEKFKCQKSFLAGDVFDCCKEMDGLALEIKLAKCSTHEQCLAQNRSQGKCHFIGSQKAKLGTVSEQVYCCFPSKLARVIHEEGRKQLGIKWGSVEKPKCRGLRLEELQKIDFSQVDFSEVVAGLPIDKRAFEQKIQNSIAPLQGKVQEQIQRKKSLFNKNQSAESFEK